jgi:hypothetical protein
MVTVSIEKRYGSATVRACITAENIGRAMELAGPGAKLLFPLDPETFFAPAQAPESIIEVRPAQLARATTMRALPTS